MTTVRLNLVGERIGTQLVRSGTKLKKRVLDASRGAADDVIGYVEEKAAEDIANAGKFSTRWNLTGAKTEGGGFPSRCHSRCRRSHRCSIGVFLNMARLSMAKPMLWIPLSFASDAQGIRARDYPGKLFRVNRKVGAPLLATGKPFAPKYFGKESVTIPKKFHLHEIIADGSKQLKLFYTERMKSNG